MVNKDEYYISRMLCVYYVGGVHSGKHNVTV